MGKAIESTLGEDRVVEEGDPLLDGPVGGDDGRGAAVPLDDNLVEVAGLLRVEAAESKVINDEQIRGEKATDHALGGVIGPGLVDEPEERIAAEEQHPASGPAGAVSEGTGKEGLSDADGSEEEDVLVALEETEAEEIADPVPVEGDGGVPVEVLKGVGLLEAGPVEAGGEALVLSAVDLVLEGELQEVEGTEGGLLGIGGPIRKGGEHSGELQTLEHGFQGRFDFSHGPSPWLGGE
jgi:hypothetical protein